MSYYVSLITRMAVLLLLLDYSSGYTGDSDTDLDPALANRDLGKNITKILHSFFAHGYDKRVRPSYGGHPVEVKVSMYIIDISSVSEVLMDFTSDFYFRQFWRDERLSFQKQPGIDELSVGSEVAKMIWLPDTFFANEKNSYFHTATTDNTFIRIKHDGSITRSMRLTVCASCPMELQYFPMDRQKCTIEVESCKFFLSILFAAKLLLNSPLIV
jgi:glycine receptor alpha-3